MQIAAAYIRVSTDEQLEFSPDAQRKALQDYANKNNIILQNEFIFIDEGISGRKAEKRPAFMKMIATAKQKPKPFDVILVHKFDRFARNREDSVVYKSLLRKECGIKVISITEQLEDDKFSIILESMLEAMAEYYSLNLADEVKKGMTEKALRGEYQTAAPLGYKNENGTLVIVEEEAEYIRYIFNEFLQNRSVFKIAKSLNLNGFKTRKGIKIKKTTIEYILRNPVYMGYTRWTKSGKRGNDYNNPDTIIAKGNFDYIIDEETFKAVQQIINESKLRVKKNSQPVERYKHYFSSLIKCSACGGSLSYIKSRNSMQCQKYMIATCSVSHYINTWKIETKIKEELDKITSTKDLNTYIKYIKPMTNNSDRVLELNKNLTSLRKKIERAEEAYINGIFDLNVFHKHKKALSNEINLISKELANLKDKEFNLDDFREKVLKVKTIFENPDIADEEKGEALRSILEKIVYDKNNGCLVYYYYF